MLVLSRKIGEQVIIGEGIVVQVLAMRGNQVRLGFAAPEEIPIRRAEVCFEIAEAGLTTHATALSEATASS